MEYLDMRNVLKCGALLATFIFLAVLPAHADSGATYTFNLSGPVSATWTMSENPTPMYFEEGTVFAVDVEDLVVGNAPVVGDILCFFNLSDSGGMNSVLSLPDLFGDQVYIGDESNPTFQTGVYNFVMWPTGEAETLTIMQTPEPGTILLLFSGLAVLGLKRKREAVN
jgi:PEP-CTERM motif